MPLVETPAECPWTNGSPDSIISQWIKGSGLSAGSRSWSCVLQFDDEVSDYFKSLCLSDETVKAVGPFYLLSITPFTLPTGVEPV